MGDGRSFASIAKGPKETHFVVATVAPQNQFITPHSSTAKAHPVGANLNMAAHGRAALSAYTAFGYKCVGDAAKTTFAMNTFPFVTNGRSSHHLDIGH